MCIATGDIKNSPLLLDLLKYARSFLPLMFQFANKKKKKKSKWLDNSESFEYLKKMWIYKYFYPK